MVELHLLKNSICIKKRLISLGIEPVCQECGWDYRDEPLWQKLPEDIKKKCIPVQLDHIDGNHFNNQLDNLRFLCPNHHALQLTSFRPKIKEAVCRRYRRIKVYEGPVIQKSIDKNVHKLSIDQVQEIRNKYKNTDISVLELSVECDISQSTVTRILTGKSWA